MIGPFGLKHADHNVPHKATVTHLFSCFCVHLQHWLNIKRLEQHLEILYLAVFGKTEKSFSLPL